MRSSSDNYKPMSKNIRITQTYSKYKEVNRDTFTVKVQLLPDGGNNSIQVSRKRKLLMASAYH